MKRIDSLIEKALRDYSPDIHEKRRQVLKMWETFAGETLSKYSRPSGYDGSILLVRTEHPAASMELELRKDELLSRMNAVWNSEIFTDIRIIARGNER